MSGAEAPSKIIRGKGDPRRTSETESDGVSRFLEPGFSSDGTHLSAGFCPSVVSEFVKHDSSAAEERNTLSIPWVVCAAILCGVGVFLVTGAVIRFAGGLDDWSWWIGVLPTVLGFLMLVNPRAGSQGPH